MGGAKVRASHSPSSPGLYLATTYERAPHRPERRQGREQVFINSDLVSLGL